MAGLAKADKFDDQQDETGSAQLPLTVGG